MLNGESVRATCDISQSQLLDSGPQAELSGATVSAENCAPIVLFAYNRPKHTLRALESLAANSLAARSTLYIYCDGPKPWENKSGVAAVRRLVRQRLWCRTVRIVEKDTNAGLANSVMGGVTEVIERHGRAIVLEDDLIVASSFLNFMNAALNTYQDMHQVMQISGYMYPIGVPPDLSATFLPITSSWGWATWARAWKYFDPIMAAAEAILRDPASRRRFDLEDSHPCSHLIELQRRNRMDSWAIRWYVSVFRASGLVLYPAQSLVQNGGFDGTGTHCTHMPDYQVELSEVPSGQFPLTPAVDARVYAGLVEFHRKLTIPKPPLLQRALRRLRQLLFRKSA